MLSDDLHRIAGAVADAYRQSAVLGSMPPGLEAATIDEARTIQDLMGGLLGRRVVGWKAGHTNPTMRERFGSEVPVPGRYFEDSLLTSPATIDASQVSNPFVEGEMGVLIAKDLPPRSRPYSSDEVADAIGSIIPVIEFAEVRCAAFGAEDVRPLTAFNAGAYRLILGESINDWTYEDVMSRRAQLLLDGEVVATEYTGADRSDFLWGAEFFANYLSERGVGLWSGQILSTGVILPYLPLGGAQEVQFVLEGSTPVRLTVA